MTSVNSCLVNVTVSDNLVVDNVDIINASIANITVSNDVVIDDTLTVLNTCLTGVTAANITVDTLTSQDIFSTNASFTDLSIDDTITAINSCLTDVTISDDLNILGTIYGDSSVFSKYEPAFAGAGSNYLDSLNTQLSYLDLESSNGTVYIQNTAQGQIIAIKKPISGNDTYLNSYKIEWGSFDYYVAFMITNTIHVPLYFGTVLS
ncbi:hypothetical protein [Heterosigma akashiwo virus 01]|uniref:Uncharacterized protein n=1 Tax=Heterosigma akashiwo virus 01 TaxID=97195 RepID=A0A1C9C5G8_HAV01|nr:hypothetical protein D1R72_gp211 [Heterosigma akashiwo virus 01]AOM63542.1 hypothetical protein [Heterosigma akashiwo virus 01]